MDDNLFPTDQQGEEDQFVAMAAADGEGEDTGTIYQAMVMSDVLPKKAELNINLDEQKEYTEGWNIQHKTEAGQGQMTHSTTSSSTDLSMSQSSSSSSLNYKAATCPAKPSDETNASDQRRYSAPSVSSVAHSTVYSRAPFPEITVKKDVQPVGSVNNNCFNAAVNESLGCASNIDISKYIAKARNLLSRRHGLSEYSTERKNEKQLKHSSAYVHYNQVPVLSDNSSDQERDHLNVSLGQASNLPGSSIRQSIVTVTPTFSMPSLGNQTLLLSSLPLCNEDSSFQVKQLGRGSATAPTNGTHVCSSEVTAKRSAPWDNAVPDMKKYRYNQTAMALQQSGLMKTTIKTAELLRKSRLLQEELRKLRRETAFLVQSVLNNPENKHLKELYINQLQTPTFKS